MIATFPLLVPPFFIPLFSDSLGFSPGRGAGLLSGFNISSAVGRLMAGLATDRIGPFNTLCIVLFSTMISLFLIWPFSDSLGPLVLFVVINGASNGGFFATIPTVVGTLFVAENLSIAMGMVVTGWAGGYLMVCLIICSCSRSLSLEELFMLIDCRALQLLDISSTPTVVEKVRWQYIVQQCSMLGVWH